MAVDQVLQPELRITTNMESQLVRCNACGGPHVGAKILPCGDSMCRRCLEHNTYKNRCLCPQCNKEHKLSATEFDAWQDDVIITMDFGPERQTFAINEADRRQSQSTVSEEAPVPERQRRPLDKVGYGQQELHSPLAVAVDINDDIYIAEFGAHRISVYNKNAQLKGVIRGQGHTEFTPTGVALNSRRQVIVTDIILFRCLIFGRSGLFVKEFGGKGFGQGQFHYPKGVDCNAGLVYVSDSKRIQVFRENGTFLRTLGDNLLSKPTSIAFSKELIVVSDSENGIFTFDYKGDLVNIIGERGTRLGQIRSPFGVTFDSDGLVVVANGFNHRVDLFKPSGEFVAKFEQPFFIVRDVAFMKHRRLVVIHGDCFQIFSTDSHPAVLRKTKSACAIL